MTFDADPILAGIGLAFMLIALAALAPRAHGRG